MSPEGFLMCYIGRKRANWYLDRNLARKNSEKEIQLLFKPNGLGHYYDKERNIPVKNHCVVCGCNDISKLSKHHTIPECFRKHFPLRWKSYRSHEVLFLYWGAGKPHPLVGGDESDLTRKTTIIFRSCRNMVVFSINNLCGKEIVGNIVQSSCRKTVTKQKTNQAM